MNLLATCFRPITLSGRKSAVVQIKRGNSAFTRCAVIGWRLTIVDLELVSGLTQMVIVIYWGARCLT